MRPTNPQSHCSVEEAGFFVFDLGLAEGLHLAFLSVAAKVYISTLQLSSMNNIHETTHLA